MLLPLFGSVEGTGSNATYTITGFTGFKITGYRLSGSTWPSGFSVAGAGGTGGVGNLRCFEGEFTRYYADAGEFGDSFDFGARIIRWSVDPCRPARSPTPQHHIQRRRNDMNRRIVGILLAVMLGVAGTFVLAR